MKVMKHRFLFVGRELKEQLLKESISKFFIDL
jgi:hypothetical protein